MLFSFTTCGFLSKKYDHESWGCLIEKAGVSQSVTGVEALDQYDKSLQKNLRRIRGLEYYHE